jgi:hypothetical protein
LRLWEERSIYRKVNSALVSKSMLTSILAAEVSTLGSIILPGFKSPGAFVGGCLTGILSKLPCESDGGVAARIDQYRPSIWYMKTYVRWTGMCGLPSERSRCLSHTWNIL